MPGPCVPGRNTGYEPLISGANPLDIAHWKITGYYAGIQGCSDNTTYKICGKKLCLDWCSDKAVNKCGFEVQPFFHIELVRKGKPIMEHFCLGIDTKVCLKGCE